MRTLFLSLALSAFSLCSNAQFVLTPNAGLMTEDGPYTILREGTEKENYEAAKKAIEKTISNADINDVEYEKSFNVTSAFKDHRKLPGAGLATYWKIEYTLFVECADDKIIVSFKHIGALEVSDKKGDVLRLFYPSTGKNSFIRVVTHLFDSKGTVAKGCKKLKEIFEEYANNLVKNIENNIK